MSKEEFYQSIKEDTSFDYEFCRNLHCQSFYDKEFLIRVMKRFEELGRKNVRYIYLAYMRNYETEREAIERPIAKRIREQIDRDYERMVKRNADRRKTEVPDGLPQDW